MVGLDARARHAVEDGMTDPAEVRRVLGFAREEAPRRAAPVVLPTSDAMAHAHAHANEA